MTFLRIEPSIKTSGYKLPQLKADWDRAIVEYIFNNFPFLQEAQPQNSAIVTDEDNKRFGIIYFSMGQAVFGVPYVVDSGTLNKVVSFIYEDNMYPLNESNFEDLVGDTGAEPSLAEPETGILSHSPDYSNSEEQIANQSPDESYPKTASIIGYPEDIIKYRGKLESVLQPMGNQLVSLIDNVNITPLDVAVSDIIVYYINSEDRKMYVYKGTKEYLDVDMNEVPIAAVPNYFKSLGYSPEKIEKILTDKLHIISPERNKKKQLIIENGFYAVDCADGTTRKGMKIGKLFLFSDGSYAIARRARGRQIERINLPYRNVSSIRTGDEFSLIIKGQNSDEVNVIPLKAEYVYSKFDKPDLIEISTEELLPNFPYPDFNKRLVTSKRVPQFILVDGKESSIVSPGTKVLMMTEEVSVKREETYEETTEVAAKHFMGDIHIDSLETAKLFGTSALDIGKFAFLMTTVGAEEYQEAFDNVKSTGMGHVKLGSYVDGFDLKLKAMEKLAGWELPAIDLYILSKFAAEDQIQMTNADIVKIIGTGTVNTDNVSRFIEYVPQLDEVLAVLTKIIINAQLYGPTDVASAAESVYNSLSSFVERLREIDSLYGE